MGSRLGQRASKSARLVLLPLFRADSGKNRIVLSRARGGGMSKDDQVARKLSWQRARKVSERPWV